MHSPVVGAHPQNYQQFMAVLCNFMVDRQREVQGEHLPHSMVYVRLSTMIQRVWVYKCLRCLSCW